MFWRPDFPHLNDCVVTKQTFCIVLLRLFLIKFRCFVLTVGFSNKDNCFQLQGIGKLIKEKLLKGIFKVGNRFSQVYCKHRLRTSDKLFLQVECFLELFFSKITLESWRCGL